MTHFNDNMTIGEARAKLLSLVEEGHPCPCCTQFAKVYKRKLSNVSARAVIFLYREHGLSYGSMPDVARKHLPDVTNQGGYTVLASHWRLIESMPGTRDDGSTRTGWWRVTAFGEQFVQAQISIPSHARIYDGRCLGFSGKPITIQDALGSRFNYYELMFS